MKRTLVKTSAWATGLILFGSISAMGAESPSTTPPPTPIFLKATKGSSKRPKAPSLQRVTCVYDGEYLHFDFMLPEGECVLTLTGGSDASYTFDSTAPDIEVYVGPIEYTTELTLTTEYGNQYSGTLEM